MPRPEPVRRGALDATLLTYRDEGFEVVATNGAPDLEASIVGDAEALFGVLKPIVDRVLADAAIDADAVSAVVLIGDTAPLQAISPPFESAFGLVPAEPPAPETAVARGAAIYGHILGRVASPGQESPAEVAGQGCLSVVVLSIIAAFVLAG